MEDKLSCSMVGAYEAVNLWLVLGILGKIVGPFWFERVRIGNRILLGR